MQSTMPISSIQLPRLKPAGPGICPALLATAALTFALIAPAADHPIGFNRDIRPILSDNCFACHGPDPGSRKAGLRLDLKESFFTPREKHGAPVIPGKPDASPLYQRITSTDPEELMPPPESHKQLKPEEKSRIKQWIEEGAPWQPHWSFIKPERPAIPVVTNWPAHGRERNPIDAFIQQRLAAKGLSPAPEADRRTLARRVALDLIGLPPTPAEIEAFVADPAPDAYEKLVRHYLNSPHWGEHRGRYWLDAARYADTHGLHFDNYREMWPYRDWVIEAFNRNQPFDQFTIEQLAGDLLPDPTPDQLIATGFHRCNITTNEGGTIEEENLASYARDRVETTSWVWLGLTANCAVCHDHKFDPIPARDFYAMSAFFRNTQQGGFDGNVKDSNPSMVVIKDGELRTRFEALAGEIDQAAKAANSQRESAKKPFETWGAQATPNTAARQLEGKLSFHAPLNEGQSPTLARVEGIERPLTPTADSMWTAPEKGKLGPGLLFNGNAHLEVADAGDFERDQQFSFGGWVYVAPTFGDGASVFARMDPDNSFRGWDLWYEQAHFATHLVHEWPGHALKIKTKLRVAKKGEWQHVFVTYDGTGKPEGVQIYFDGRRVETEVAQGSELTESIRTKVPFTIGQRYKGSHFNGGGVQDLRLYSRVLKPVEIRALSRLHEWRQAFYQPVVMWDKEVRNDLFDFYLNTQVPEFEGVSKQLAALEKEREGIRMRFPVTHIQKEKTNSMPMARLLYRGQYDQPKEELKPAVFSGLNPLPSGAPPNRLGLARWLVSPDNPLMARVTVNRFWQELFGTGLVKTSEDFGIMGESPTHPELLDWLAVEFRESGWDVKRLFTLMVTSETYRQASVTTAEKLEKDPGNRLLSRGPRFRMDAEMIRDYALAASGLLVPKIGGASVKPYQPDGVWEPVAMPESNTKKYQRGTGEALHRRSLYTFWKRAAPPASMDIFNAPSRETSCLRRERTDTPLQALNTLNDVQFIEAARRLAALALKSHPDNPDQTLDEISERLLGRPLRPEELNVVRNLLNNFTAYYDSDPDAAKKLITFGEVPPDASIPPTRLAAFTMVANGLMNLDEVLNK